VDGKIRFALWERFALEAGAARFALWERFALEAGAARFAFTDSGSRWRLARLALELARGWNVHALSTTKTSRWSSAPQVSVWLVGGTFARVVPGERSERERG
jgi:hypothetical protein